jgi:hypothetical protein
MDDIMDALASEAPNSSASSASANTSASTITRRVGDSLEVYQLERALEESSRVDGGVGHGRGGTERGGAPSSPHRPQSSYSSASTSPITAPRSGLLTPSLPGVEERRTAEEEEEEGMGDGDGGVHNVSTDIVEIDSPLSNVSPSKDVKPYFPTLYQHREVDEAILAKSLLLSVAFHIQVAIFSFLDPVALSRVACASGLLYLASSHDLIWKGRYPLCEVTNKSESLPVANTPYLASLSLPPHLFHCCRAVH